MCAFRAEVQLPSKPRTRCPMLLMLMFLCTVTYASVKLFASQINPRLPTASAVEYGLRRSQSFQPPQVATQKRIAVCITGHLRSFAQKGVQQSIRRQLIDPLESEKNAVDVFFHIPYLDKLRPLRRRRAIHALKSFAPVRVSYYQEKESEQFPWKKCRNKTVAPEAYPYALLRGEQCMREVEQHETEKHITYDWVYKTRPDVAFGARISKPTELQNDTLYVNMHVPGASTHSHNWLKALFPENGFLIGQPVGDHVLVASRRVAKEAFYATKALTDCRLYEMPNGKLNAEVVLTYWLARRGIPYQPMPWFWMLVRDSSGPECDRVKWIRDEGQLRNADLMQSCMSFRKTGRI